MKLAFSTKSDLVFETLKDMINDGRLKPGERISAIEIARQLGVSRTPVNEAVKRLEDRRMVRILPNVGFEIARLPWKDLYDLMKLKIVLEQTAIKWIEERDIVVNLDPLFDISDRIIQAIKDKDRNAYNSLVREYHSRLIASAGSPVLLSTFNGIWDYRGWEDTRFQELSADLIELSTDHRDTLMCLKNRQFREAHEIAEQHGERWIKLFKKSFGDSESW